MNSLSISVSVSDTKLIRMQSKIDTETDRKLISLRFICRPLCKLLSISTIQNYLDVEVFIQNRRIEFMYSRLRFQCRIVSMQNFFNLEFFQCKIVQMQNYLNAELFKCKIASTVSTNTAMRCFPKRMTYVVVSI